MASMKNVGKGLRRVYDKAERWDLDPASAKYVVLSDHHKGKRDKADDFVKSERAYHAALGYYLAAGYTLFVLGDVEELWECHAKHVIKAYQATLDLEAEFHRQNRYVRFFGNHDDQWEKQASFDSHLGRWFGGLKMREGLRLALPGPDPRRELFLVHGHQGTFESDKIRWLAKPVVRYLWRPFQRITGIRLTTPATSFSVRGDHSRAMYNWAASMKPNVVLLAGHTHKPVFLTESETARLEAEARRLESETPVRSAAVAEARSELEWMRTMERVEIGGDAASLIPCYFNTGCCSFSDGDCTGIEIADGKISLVRWPDDEGRPRKKVLRSANIEDVFRQLV